jgi:hypothetical protein
MELYSEWKYYVDGKMEGLRVIVQYQREPSEKKKTVILKNLVAAGYDIQKLLDDYTNSPSDESFKGQLKQRIQRVKGNNENYLLDTRCASAGEVVNTVMRYLRRNRLRPY